MALKTRKPTGQVPPPVVLLEGETGSGRSWTAAELSTSPRVGRMLWIELGDESTADQYGAIPNVNYEIVRPDNGDDADESWDWHTLYQAARDAKAEATRAAAAGEKPVVTVVDHVGHIWDMLSEWAENRARSSSSNKEALAADPNAAIDVSSNYWNDAGARWRKLMTVFLTSPGITVLLSKGEEVTLFENGKPTKKRTWKVAGQKAFTSSMPIWVRMSREANPQLIKLRSVHNGIRPGVDRQQAMPGFTLEKLIFERYGWDPTSSGARQFVPLVAGSDAPLSDAASVIELAASTAEDEQQLRGAYERIQPALDRKEVDGAEARHLARVVKSRKAELGLNNVEGAAAKTAVESGPVAA